MTLFPYRVTSSDARARLVCFPFAGGSASAYREWSTGLAPDIEVCAVELPGHGRRVAEPCYDDVDALFTDLAHALTPFRSLPTFVYGHSFGALLAFELARRTKEVAGAIVAASRAAYTAPANKYKVMSRAALTAQMRRFGGTPSEVFDDPSLFEAFLDGFVADINLASSLAADAGQKVACPLIALAAHDDIDVPLRGAKAWSVHTTGTFRFVRLSGGHFFLTTQSVAVQAEVTKFIDIVLAKADATT